MWQVNKLYVKCLEYCISHHNHYINDNYFELDYNNEDYNRYKSQYTNIKLKINNNIHDRFIIIDNKELYHVGASFKDLGKKCFGINKIESKEWLNKILKLTIK